MYIHICKYSLMSPFSVTSMYKIVRDDHLVLDNQLRISFLKKKDCSSQLSFTACSSSHSDVSPIYVAMDLRWGSYNKVWR